MTSDTLLLEGLDGGNLLGFMAAIGTLRLVSRTERITMSWEERSGVWTPHLMGVKSQDGLLDMLESALVDSSPAFDMADDLKINASDFRKYAQESLVEASLGDRAHADFVAAFGCDAIANAKTRIIQDTRFRTMSGASNQHFLKTMRVLVKETKRHHLRTSLFKRWQYMDGKPNLRWDPQDDRRHALRWTNPSNDELRTMRGANRLAIEALPMFPTAPIKGKLRTTGFSQLDNVTFTWPIWNVPLGVDTVRSLLGLAALQECQPDRYTLRDMGVIAIYRCRRINVGMQVSFTQAQSSGSF